MKNFIRNIEKYIMKNIFLITLIFVIVIILLILKRIDITSYLNLIFALIAFYFGYRKYERDKELEIISNYTKKYNSIILELNNYYNATNIENLLNLWYEEYYLFNKWYISEELWSEWLYWIKKDIYKIAIEEWEFIDLIHDPKYYEDDIKKITDFKWFIFFSIIFSTYWKYNDYYSKKENYYNFLLSQINELWDNIIYPEIKAWIKDLLKLQWFKNLDLF